MTMQTVDGQALSTRVSQLEKRLARLRRELKQLRGASAFTASAPSKQLYRTASKTALRQHYAELLVDLKIERKPMGALALQQELHQAGLMALNMSAEIVAMREE